MSAQLVDDQDVNVLYRGISEGLGHDRVYVERSGTTQPLAHYVRHSPSGFSWGYAGSGPADTARCILADFLRLTPLQERVGLYSVGSMPEIDGLYQDFKDDFVAPLPENGGAWDISGCDIAAWLRKHPPTSTCVTCRSPYDLDDPFPCIWCPSVDSAIEL